MSSYNPINQQTSSNLSSSVENKGLFNRLLRNLSNFGMRYDDMIMRNTIGVGINEDPYSQKDNNMYSFMSQKAVASVLNKKSIPYLDKSHADKIRILREYSIKDEIRDFVSKVADESIVYSDNHDFCSPKPLSNDISQDIKDKYQEYFEKIYNRYGFSDGITAWYYMKRFLVDGNIAIEIVWDDKKKNIIHFNALKPETLVVGYEPTIGTLWIQFPEDPQLRRIFLDSQIIFISYSTQDDFAERSYVEGLIKPYNQLKILEQTKIMFNIMNASVHQVFKIPVDGLPKHKAEEQISQMIADYSEEIEFDDSLGTVSIKGRKHLPYNRQIWFPSTSNGSPEMSMEKPQGHDLNEDDMLKWFFNIFKRASRIPFGRLDSDNGGGSMALSSDADTTRDEMTFNNFINRIRSNYKELIVKPLKLQMCVEFPELREDDTFINQIDIEFYSNQLFEEFKRLNNMQKRSEIITSLLSIQRSEGQPYFHIDFLMNKYMKLSQEDMEENKSYWIKENKKTNTQGNYENTPNDYGGESNIGNPPTEMNPNGLGKEQPSTETPSSTEVGNTNEPNAETNVEPSEGSSEFGF